MAEDLERMKKKRGTFRALATRIMHKIENELVKADEIDRTALEVAVEQLSDKDASLRELNREIEIAVADDALEEEILASEDYQERIISCKKRALLALTEDEASDPTTTAEVEEQPQLRAIGESSCAAVKLPRLTIEKFKGDARQWQTFWSQFGAAIHHSPGLSQVDKFNYLKSFVEGSALNAIAGLTLSNENYEVAVDILTQRYGRKDIVTNAHMNELLSLHPVKHSSDIKGLRKLYDCCELQIRSLESLGVVTEAYGALLCPILTKLLPSDIVLEYSRRRALDDNWNVGHVLEFLKIEVESRERADLMSGRAELEKSKSNLNNQSDNYSKKAKDNWRTRDQNARSTAAALNTAIENNCLFCSATQHKSDDYCVKSLDEKMKILRKQGRCFLCLQAKQHIARFCSSKIKCKHCGRRHNTSLCGTKHTKEVDETKGSNLVLSSLAGKGGVKYDILADRSSSYYNKFAVNSSPLPA